VVLGMPFARGSYSHWTWQEGFPTPRPCVRDATGNLLERNYSSSPFLSAHEAVQADVWSACSSVARFDRASDSSTNLTLYPDQFERLLTSDGTFAPNGLTTDRSTNYYSEFGAGWRFTTISRRVCFFDRLWPYTTQPRNFAPITLEYASTEQIFWALIGN